MTPDEAYTLAIRIKSLGLAYFPKSPQTLIELGTNLQPLRADQANDVVLILTQWSQWDVGKFSRAIAALRAADRSKPKEEKPEKPPHTAEQVAAAEHQAEAIPEDSQVYQEVCRQWVKTITEQFGEGHASRKSPLLEKNLRLRLITLILAGRLPTIDSEREPSRHSERHEKRIGNASQPRRNHPRR